MSNGKVWRDGRHTVQRSHKKNWSYNVMGADHKKHKWFFRAKLKNGKYGSFEDLKRLAHGRPASIEFFYW